MKKVQWGLLFCLVCCTAFMLGIFAGFVKSRITQEHETEEPIIENVKPVAFEEETLPKYIRKTDHYLVTIEADNIILSEVFDDKSEAVIEITEISKSVLPESDVILLEEGIAFSDKDEALMMIENFVS